MEKKQIIGSAVCVLLTVLGLIGSVYGLINGGILTSAIHIVMLLAVLYYAVSGYRRPHGNLLRYVTVLYAFSLLFSINQTAMKSAGHAQTGIVLYILAIMGIMFVAGRLNKIKQNAFLMPAIFALLAAAVILGYIKRPQVNFFKILNTFSVLTVWIEICFSYFIRYKKHKEAGFEE